MKRKKLSKFFIDQKIPVHEKEKIWVLECNRRIVWVAGMRLDDRFKIGKDTQEIVRIEYKQA
jgi:tRNA(Ile)-lysidine synthase